MSFCVVCLLSLVVCSLDRRAADRTSSGGGTCHRRGPRRRGALYTMCMIIISVIVTYGIIIHM